MALKSAQNRVFIYILSVLAVYPLFFRGLFFEEDAFLHVILSTVIFGFFVFYYNKRPIPYTKLDWSLLAFVIMYIIVIAVSYNIRESIVKAIRVLDYYMIYLMIKETINNLDDCLIYIKASCIGGVGVALFGLAAALKIIDVPWAAVDGRIYSTLQYPNTLAVFLLGIFIFTVYMLLQENNRVWQIVYLMGSYIVMITFWGAHSRMVMVLYPFIIVLFVIGLPKGYRLMAVLYNIALFFIPFLFSSLIMPFDNAFHGISLLWFLGGAIVACLLAYINKDWVANTVEKLFSQKIFKVIGVAVLALCIFSVAFLTINNRLNSVNLNIGQNLLNKIELGFGDASLQTRFTLYQDAFRIIKDHPVLGTGGGGWKAVYYQYQRHYYQINDVHSSVMDVWIETGTIGLMIFLTVWVMFFYSSGRIWLSDFDNTRKSVAWAITVAVLALGLHSFLDFDFSLGAISILLWSCFAILNGVGTMSEKPVAQRVNYNKIIKFAVLGFAIISAAFSGANIMAGKYSDAAELNYSQGNWEEAEVGFKQAASLDPLSSKYDYYIGKTLGTIGEVEGKPEMFEKGLPYAIKAVEKDPANADAHFLKAKMHLALGDYDNALKEVELTYQYTPFNQKALNYLAQMYLIAAKHEIANGNVPLSREYLEKAVVVPQKVDAIIKGLDPVRRKLWIETPLVTVTSEMKQAVDEAQRLLKVTGEK